jgi:ppGpp synthetase/RelA/SpoT-type nucleotidyltranferase
MFSAAARDQRIGDIALDAYACSMASSKSATDRAGERIRRAVRAGHDPSADDMAVLESFRAGYLPHLLTLQDLLTAMADLIRDRMADLLAELPAEEETFLSVASRPKTLEAVVAKLARERTRLTQMQDIAGGRIVVPLLRTQNAVLDALREGFTEETGLPIVRLTDTRASGDEHGYRAVHVVVSFDGDPVEIQIRTAVQQAWAQRVEDLDRQLGTDLKHGHGPAEWLEWLLAMSDVGVRLERGEDADIPDPPAN